jgi:hypothetical protein
MMLFRWEKLELDSIAGFGVLRLVEIGVEKGNK